MTRTIAHRELRNNSSAILREVKAGETFTITNHGEAVAVIQPVGSGAPAIPLKTSTARGRFSEIESAHSDVSTADILEDLRTER